VGEISKSKNASMQDVKGGVELNAASSGGMDKSNARGGGVQGDRAQNLLVCHRCKVAGHFAKDCGRPWMGDRIGRNHQEHGGVVVTNLSELIAPLCATQAVVKPSFAYLTDHLLLM
jgi:hypothetical protein